MPRSCRCCAYSGRQGWVSYASLDVRGGTDTVAVVTPAVSPPIARATATPLPTRACLTGHVYNVAGGVPLRNWVVQLQTPNGTVYTARSLYNGLYRFSDLAPGTYTVSERVEPGWRVVSPPVERCSLSARQGLRGDGFLERTQPGSGWGEWLTGRADPGALRVTTA